MCYACKYKDFPHYNGDNKLRDFTINKPLPEKLSPLSRLSFYSCRFHLHIVFEHLYNKERRNVKLKKYFRPAATHIFCHSRLFLNFAKVWPVRCAAHD